MSIGKPRRRRSASDGRFGGSVSPTTATTSVATPVLGRSSAGERQVAGGTHRLGVDLPVAFTLVATREPATAHVARERFFAGVCAQVRGQVVN